VGLATLSIDFIARLAKLEADLGKAATIAERNAKRMEDSYSRASSVIRDAFAGLSSVISVGVFANLIDTAIDSADALSKLSQRTGETVESLSKLKYAGSLADADIEVLATSTGKLAKNMSAAVGGTGDAADAFRAMKVEFQENGALRSTGDVINDIADRFASYEDSAGKAALAQALFGKSGADLIPLLNAGSQGLKDMGDEAQRLGVVISTETAQGAEKFNDQMTRINAVMSSFFVQTSAELLPLFNELADSLVNIAKDGEGVRHVFPGITEVLRGLIVIGGNVAFVFKGIGTEIGGMAAQIAALSRLDFKGFSNIGKAMREDAAANRKSFDAWQQGIIDAGKTFDNYSNEGHGRGVAAAGKGAAPLLNTPAAPRASGGRTAKAIDDGQRLVEQLRDQVRATQDLTNVEKLELAIADGKYKTATAGNLELARGYAEILDAIQANKDAAAAEADAWRERLAVLAEGARVFDATRTPMEALDIELSRLTELLDAGAISMDTFGRAASMAGANFITIMDKVKETDDVLNEFAKSGARNIQSAFADFLFDPFKDGLSGMAQAFGNTIKRMVAEAVSADLMKRIFGDLSKGGLGTGWLASLGKLFPNADGGVYSSPSLSQYSGQVVSKPTFFANGGNVMGEAGPEGIFPLKRNSSGQLGVIALGSGGGHTFNITLNGITNESDGRRAAGQISRRILSGIASAQRFI
jgi:hypothetical protein